MFCKINDFITLWQQEQDATLKILNALTDESLSKKPNDDVRSIGGLASHIVETITEMPHRLGLVNVEKNIKFSSVQALTEAYAQDSNEMVKAIKEKWNDADLEKENNMYGEQWKNKFSLQVLVLHQCHHRGQLTTLMRFAGLEVPGIYGPAKEEWSAMNMSAPE